KNPDCWLAHDSLGNEFLNRGIFDQAESHFRAALAIDPRHAEGHCNLGVALLEQAKLDGVQNRMAQAKQKTDEAIYHFGEALKANPNHIQSQANLGLALAQQGRLEEAKTALRKVFLMEPNYGKAHLDLATVYFQEGSMADAKREILE